MAFQTGPTWSHKQDDHGNQIMTVEQTGGRKDDERKVVKRKIGELPILRFPSEIVKVVLTFVTDKQDLFHCCIVSKLFLAHAQPCLYRAIDITIGAEMADRLVDMFNVKNGGLKHIQHIVVRADSTYVDGPEQTNKWLRFMVIQLQSHHVKTFSWAIPHPLPATLSQLLWDTQPNLRNLEIVPVFNQNIQAPAAYVGLRTSLNKVHPAGAQALRAAVDSLASASLASTALQLTDPSQLEVDARQWTGGDAQEVGSDTGDDSSDGEQKPQVADPLTDNLLAHLPRVKPGQLPAHHNLNSLSLKDVDLKFCKHTWLTYYQFAQLKHLALEHCVGADLFLLQLATGVSTPSLQNFTLVHDLGVDSDRTIHGIEELLRFPKNKVKNLQLCLRNAPKLPSASVVRSHGDSIRYLLIDICGKSGQSNNNTSASNWASSAAEALVYETSDFETIITSCTKLVELGLAIPAVGLEYRNLDKKHTRFLRWIDNIIKHTKIVTLNVLNWPEKYQFYQSKGYYYGMNPSLARLASDVFTRFRSYDLKTETFMDEQPKCKLEIVAFGVNEMGASVSPKPAYYVQEEAMFMGKRQIQARSLTLDQLQRQDLDTKILEYEARNFDHGSRSALQVPDDGGDDSEDGDDGWVATGRRTMVDWDMD